MAIITLSACMASHGSYEKSFDQSLLKKVKKGVTKKAELLSHFGPPVARAWISQDFDVPVQLPPSAEVSNAHAVFTSRNTCIDKHRVYYYNYLTIASVGSFPPIIYMEWDNLHNLWFLVNEQSGIVDDFLYVRKDIRKELKAERKRRYKDYRRRLEEQKKASKAKNPEKI